MRIETIGNATLYLGDCLESMRRLPDCSVDAIVTDPPYGLAFMGKKWDYDVPSVEVWAECLRVLKPGGHLLAFAGTRTQHRMAVRIEDAGFEIRDMIAWVYGSGFPKSLDVSKAIDKAAGAEREVVGSGKGRTGAAAQPNGGSSFSDDSYQWPGDYDITAPATAAARQWQGWGTALKPALEPITVARKPLAGTVAANVLAHGTGALNIDGCRVAFSSDADREAAAPGGKTTAKSGSLAGKAEYPGCDDFAPDTLNPDPADRDVCTSCFYRGADHAPRAEFVPKGNDAGRWPANLIHDGSDEVLAGFPESKGQQGDVRGTEPSRTGGEGANCYGEYGRVASAKRGDTGSAARFFYCAKASKADRGAGNNHPTVKPTDLMRYLCRLVTPPGGVVLDPFMGSGSTGKAAVAEGFRFIGIERDERYFEVARSRIEGAKP